MTYREEWFVWLFLLEAGVSKSVVLRSALLLVRVSRSQLGGRGGRASGQALLTRQALVESICFTKVPNGNLARRERGS